MDFLPMTLHIPNDREIYTEMRPTIGKCCTQSCGFWYHERCCWTLLYCIAAAGKNQKWNAPQNAVLSTDSSIWGEFHTSIFSHSFFRSGSVLDVAGLVFFFCGWQLPFEVFIPVRDGRMECGWCLVMSMSLEKSIARNFWMIFLKN